MIDEITQYIMDGLYSAQDNVAKHWLKSERIRIRKEVKKIIKKYEKEN